MKQKCKSCTGEYHPDGLRGGVCFMCIREPVENKPMTIFEKLMAFGVAVFLAAAVGVFLFGCAPDTEPKPAQFRVISGYHDYQQFTAREAL